jgi:Domain of unknown function (DUF4403)
MPDVLGTVIRIATAPIRVFGRSRRFRWTVGAVVVIGGSFYGALWALDRVMTPGTPPALVNLPPLPALQPVTRSSYVIAPVAISIDAIRASMEAAAPRELLGKNDNPVSALLSAADIGITVERGPLALYGKSDDLAVAASLNGSLKISGQIATQAGQLVGSLAGLIGNAINDKKSGSGGSASKDDNPIGGLLSGLFGDNSDSSSKSGGNGTSTSNNNSNSKSNSKTGNTAGDATTKVLDQRVDVKGQVVVHSRPQLTENWRVQPNLSAQLDLGDSKLQLAGLDINMTQEAKPMIDEMVKSQVANLEQWLRNLPIIEQSARAQWAKMCRAIPLGGGDTGLPRLWLEMRPVRAAAAQPRIDQQNVTLTVGVLAETRITPSETKPDCPFPAKLEMTAPMDDGRLQVGMPIDVPFTEIDKLLQAQLRGHRYPEDNSAPADVEVRHVHIGAAGDKLLIALDVKVREKKSWFGFGASATVQIWGKPVLDKQNQILRLTDLAVDVNSDAAFGLLSAAAKAAIPYVKQALAEHAVIDLKPFAADARKKIGEALAEFQRDSGGVRVDAAVTDVRLSGIAFDSHTLRVIAEADGNAKVAVSQLPKF